MEHFSIMRPGPLPGQEFDSPHLQRLEPRGAGLAGKRSRRGCTGLAVLRLAAGATLRAMVESFDKPQAVMLAIAELSGESYGDVTGPELIEALERRGVTFSGRTGLYNLMHRLKSSRLVEWSGGGGMDVRAMGLIRLSDRGRQQIEGWPTDGHGHVIGDDNTIVGNVPPRSMGSRNVIVGPTDDKGDIRLGGGTAMGYGARADPTSVAVGSGAMAGAPTLVPLLREFAAKAPPEAIDIADDLIAHIEARQPNSGRIERLWSGLKALGTTEELIALAARIEPLVHHLL